MDNTLAKDLVVMWQSELTAMAADREVGESWAAFMTLWAQSAHAALAYSPHDIPAGSPSTAQPARSAPVAAASRPSLGEVEQLSRRVAELEQRLAELMVREHGPDGSGAPEGGV